MRLDTGCRECVIDVTRQVQGHLAECKAGDGLLLVYTPHTTAALVVNEAEPGLMDDMIDVLKKLIPRGGWRHDRIDDNAWSHLSALLLGPGVVVPVRHGRLGLGTWQRILFVELDGPRHRVLEVIFVGGELE